MPKISDYSNDATIQPNDKLLGSDTDGSSKNYLLSELTTYFSGKISILQDEMPVSTYDPAGIEEQLVGLTATQTITNKAIDFSSSGTNTLTADASDIDVTAFVGIISGANVQEMLEDIDTYVSDAMFADDYDPAGIEEQVVGIAAAQTLTNKTMDFSSTGTNNITIDSSDIDYDNATSGLTATDPKAALDELTASINAIKNVHGWGYYQDSESAPSTLTVTSTATKALIDGEGGATVTSYLPLEIRGTSDLWDEGSDYINPISSGDSYMARLDLTISGETGSPNEIIVQLDIGGGASPSSVILSSYVSTGKATPYKVSIPIPFFTGDTFNANGGQIFLSTDSGSVEISSRAIFINRISSGSIA